MGRKMKLTQEQCNEIITKSPTCSAKKLADEYAVSVPTIYNVVNKRPPYDFLPRDYHLEEVVAQARRDGVDEVPGYRP